MKANQNREAILSGRGRPRAVSVAVPATPETDVPSIEIAFFVCYPVVWWINLAPNMNSTTTRIRTRIGFPTGVVFTPPTWNNPYAL